VAEAGVADLTTADAERAGVGADDPPTGMLIGTDATVVPVGLSTGVHSSKPPLEVRKRKTLFAI
jgi:hypothetical protein